MTRRSTTAALVVALLASACSGARNQVAPISIAPTVPSTTVSPAPSSSVAAPTAPAVASTTSSTVPNTEVPEGPTFSDDLGVKVDTAPGVTTKGDTRQLLPEGLYVHIAWESDPNDPAVVTVQPEDIPILEAYANAIATYYKAATGSLTLDDPDFAKYYVDKGEKFSQTFSTRRATNQALMIGSGVVLRPYVIDRGEASGVATVLDCFLADEAYGERGATKDVSTLEAQGGVFTLRLQEARWMVEVAAVSEDACGRG
jgi:hypothetical protein